MCSIFSHLHPSTNARTGSIRIANMLLQLKRQRPADVHILAGVRDVITLCRLRHGLTDAAMAELPLPALPPGGRGKSCREYLVDLVLAAGGVGAAADVTDDAVAAVNTKVPPTPKTKP